MIYYTVLLDNYFYFYIILQIPEALYHEILRFDPGRYG